MNSLHIFLACFCLSILSAVSCTILLLTLLICRITLKKKRILIKNVKKNSAYSLLTTYVLLICFSDALFALSLSAFFGLSLFRNESLSLDSLTINQCIPLSIISQFSSCSSSLWSIALISCFVYANVSEYSKNYLLSNANNDKHDTYDNGYGSRDHQTRYSEKFESGNGSNSGFTLVAKNTDLPSLKMPSKLLIVHHLFVWSLTILLTVIPWIIIAIVDNERRENSHAFCWMIDSYFPGLPFYAIVAIAILVFTVILIYFACNLIKHCKQDHNKYQSEPYFMQLSMQWFFILYIICWIFPVFEYFYKSVENMKNANNWQLLSYIFMSIYGLLSSAVWFNNRIFLHLIRNITNQSNTDSNMIHVVSDLYRSSFGRMSFSYSRDYEPREDSYNNNISMSSNVEMKMNEDLRISESDAKTVDHRKQFSKILHQYPPPRRSSWSSDLQSHVHDSANAVSAVLVSYMCGLMMKGYRKTLELKDLELPPKIHQLEYLYERFLQTYVPRRTSSSEDFCFTFDVSRTLLQLNKRKMIQSSICHLLHCWVSISGVLFFQQLIEFLYHENASIYEGIGYAFGIAICQALASFCSSRAWVLTEELGIGSRNLIMGLLFRKVLRIPGHTFNGKQDDSVTTGQIVNTMSNDAERIYLMFRNGLVVPLAFVNFATIIIVMVFVVGYESLIGFIVMAVLLVINVVLGKRIAVVRKTALQFADDRVKFLSEMLNGIRVLKMYAWEIPLQNVIHDIRSTEMKWITHVFHLYSLFMTTYFEAHYITIVGILSLMYAMGKPITVASVYVVIQFVSSLRLYLIFMGMITYVIDGFVAIDRVEKILDLADHKDLTAKSGKKSRQRKKANEFTREIIVSTIAVNNEEFKYDEMEDESMGNIKLLVRLRNASFLHEPNSQLNMLKNITVDISKNELICVIGSVGSGKSTFMQSLLGETLYQPTDNDSVFEFYKENDINFAYIGQTLFIMNGTIRDNIIMNNTFDAYSYNLVIEACALVYDLQLFAAGDSTEIGEKGINLSGGQKARISIARAFYQHLHQPLDILLFDDPLSALDNDVAQHIFHKGILTLARNTTAIIVLNSHLHFLDYFDRILVMQYINENIENASYCKLAENCNCRGKNGSHNLQALKEKYHSLIQELIKNKIRERKESNADENGTDIVMQMEIEKMIRKSSMISLGEDGETETSLMFIDDDDRKSAMFNIEDVQKQKAKELGLDFDTVAKLVSVEDRKRGGIVGNSLIRYLDGAYPGHGIIVFIR